MSMTKLDPKKYSLTSTWRFNAAPEQIWAALIDPETWPQWWPSLTAAEGKLGGDGHVGASSNLTFRAPLGYPLKMTITITSINPMHQIDFTSQGDLLGSGDMQMSTLKGITTLNIHWNVATTKPWMNHFGSLLSLPFQLSHAAVMSSGEQGLQRYLTK
jgi:hypothetical protein